MADPRLRPPRVEIPRTAAEDPRLGSLLGQEPGARVVLVGFPSDEGVRRNGGRLGAAEGPAALRRQLYRMTPDARRPEAFRRLLAATADIGDVAVTGDLERDQELLAEIVGEHLARGRCVIVLGGGHEVAYGHFLGYVRGGRPVELLNLDAHPDVRPPIDGRGHSGSPFRQALDHPSGLCRGYRVAGLQRHAVAAGHLELMSTRGARFWFAEELTPPGVGDLFAGCRAATLASFDLDAVDSAFAPGVSAPAAGGLLPSLWLDAARRAGETLAVTSMEVAELNPRYDVDDRSARLAALTVWSFLSGLSTRPSGS